MKKKIIYLVINLVLFSAIIAAFVIFINMPFEVDFTLVGKYPMGDDINDVLAFYTTTGFYSVMLQRDVGSIYASDKDFNNYVNAFDFSEGFLIFSSRKPLKKVVCKYNRYYHILYNLITFNSTPKVYEYTLIADIELDDSVETTDYYYLYKITDKRVYKTVTHPFK